MKHAYYLLALTTVLFTPALTLAQCTVPVPDNVIVVTEDDSSTSVIQQALFMCSGTYVSASSIDPVIFLESGAHMNFSGFSKNIYAKAGSIVDGSGIDDTIYYELGAQLLINGLNQTLIECTPLVFDFGPLGINPCYAVSGIDTPTTVQVALYPTVPCDQLHIVRSANTGPAMITVLDPLGRVMRSEATTKNEVTLDVSGYAAGAYRVVISAEALRWTGSFLKP
jgi:hypothetical protein